MPDYYWLFAAVESPPSKQPTRLRGSRSSIRCPPTLSLQILLAASSLLSFVALSPNCACAVPIDGIRATIDGVKSNRCLRKQTRLPSPNHLAETLHRATHHQAGSHLDIVLVLPPTPYCLLEGPSDGCSSILASLGPQYVLSGGSSSTALCSIAYISSWINPQARTTL